MKRTIFYSLDDREVKIRRCIEQSCTIGISICDYFDGVMPAQEEAYEFWDGDYYFVGCITEYHKSNVDDWDSYIRVEVFGEPKTKEG